MPFYHTLGSIPHKRHTQFKKLDGNLYREEVMGLEGFSSIQSILYHHFLPPRVKRTEACCKVPSESYTPMVTLAVPAPSVVAFRLPPR